MELKVCIFPRVSDSSVTPSTARTDTVSRPVRGTPDADNEILDHDFARGLGGSGTFALIASGTYLRNIFQGVGPERQILNVKLGVLAVPRVDVLRELCFMFALCSHS